MSSHISEYTDNLPSICGAEDQLLAGTMAGDTRLAESGIDLARLESAFAIALHMHQPLIPAGGNDLRVAAIISNLQYMMENPHIGDNHNAPVFLRCYRRIGEFVHELVREGKQPRVMLDYSGCLLYGLQQMGAHDVFDGLRRVTCDPAYRHCVEWLGTAWGHAVAPSTPVQDFRLHVKAWQYHFADLFGQEALRRVAGFSSPEMALPNHPDVAYEFVKTLKDCGYGWLLVQEHSVERVLEGPDSRPSWHMPHRLVARNSRGESASIVAIIKTQGSDTKLVAQMQPYYEAKGLARMPLAGKQIPPLVTQIGDGENGGVMMNEFPGKFFEVMREASGSKTPPLNVSEYLAYLRTLGITEADLPPIQPLHQRRLWERLRPGDGPERLATLIEELKREDHRFHMEGGSWTSNLTWVRGYENVLGPMEAVSAFFAEKALGKVPPQEYRYCNALYHLLVSQTSCYRYWGQGIWTDYARELCRRATEILTHDF